MKIPNWKTHAKFIGAIIIAVLAVFYFGGYFNPQQAQTQLAKSPYSIRIQEASWGLNCAEESASLLQDLKKRASSATGEVYDNIVKEMEALQPLPARNNALELLKNHCDGGSSCNISLAEGGLPLSRNEFCYYELTFSYLCSSFDALRDGKISHSETDLLIDCAAPIEAEKSE